MSFVKMWLGLVCPDKKICAGERRNTESRSTIRTDSVALVRPWL